jgi:NAD(P)H-hydrate repair Nnr-like enzyme with NAD(P)H-hydrate dehydratase domain
MAALPDGTVVLLSGSTEPNGDALAASSAAAAVGVDALTPASLHAVWDERHSS